MIYPCGSPYKWGSYDEMEYGYPYYDSSYPYVGYSRRGSSDTDWSGIAKVGIVVGGLLAVYLIYKVSEQTKPMAKDLGKAAGSFVRARYGGDLPALKGRNSGSTGRLLAVPDLNMSKPFNSRVIEAKLLPASSET